MADDASGAKKAPTVLRIKLRYDDLDMFVERFAPNIGRAGLFIRTRTPKPVGSEVRFELRLADDKPIVVGLGIVRWIKEYDPRRPRAAHGMGVEFTRVTRESRAVLLRVLEHRKAHGMIDGERGLPVPLDEDEAIPAKALKDDHSAPVEAPALDDFRTGPVAAPKLTPHAVEPLPEPVAEPSPVAQPAALAPEPARRARVSLEALVAAAAAAPAAEAAIDDDALLAFLADGLDVGATIARARAYAGGDADAELDALLAAEAAPVDVSIGDASARLAAMLGTPAVPARRRSAAAAEFAEGTKETGAVAEAVAEPVAVAAAEPVAESVAAAEPVAESVAVEPARPERVDEVDESKEYDGDGEGITHPVDPDLLALAAAVDATPITAPVVKIEPADLGDGLEFNDSERTAIADRSAIAAMVEDDPTDAPTIAVIVETFDDERPTELRPGREVIAALRPPPRGEFDAEVDVDTLVKGSEDVAAVLHAGSAEARPLGRAPSVRPDSLPPPPTRGKPRTVPPPPPRSASQTIPDPASSPALDIAAAHESSSGSIDITGLVLQLEAEAAEPQPLAGRDEGRDLAAQAMNADELIDGMRDIGRRRPPSGPAPDLASFADPPDNPSAPRTRPARTSTVDDALAALESLSFEEGSEETAVSRARDLAVHRPPTPRPARAPTPRPDPAADDDDDFSVDIEIDGLDD